MEIRAGVPEGIQAGVQIPDEEIAAYFRSRMPGDGGVTYRRKCPSRMVNTSDAMRSMRSCFSCLVSCLPLFILGI